MDDQYELEQDYGGDDYLISPLIHPELHGCWRTLRIEVYEASIRFWNKDQVCGFDENGKRIGTGIPRQKPSYENEYSI